MGSDPRDLTQLDLNWIHNRIQDYFEIYDEDGKDFSMQNTPGLLTLRTRQTPEKVIHFVSKSDGTHRWMLPMRAPVG
jgi:hypothetical protein